MPILEPDNVAGPVLLQLNTLLTTQEQSEPSENGLTRPIRITPGSDFGQLPNYIEIPIVGKEDEVVQELKHWGRNCHAFLFGHHDKGMRCISITCSATPTSTMLRASSCTLRILACLKLKFYKSCINAGIFEQL